MRQSPHLSDEQIRLFFHQFQLDLEVGVASAVGRVDAWGNREVNSLDPVLALQWSDDKGRRWSDEMWVTAGRLGRYRHRAIWRRLGHGRNRTWRVVMDAAVPWRLVNAYVQASKGTS